MALNERGYEQHPDYLYDGALIQMQNRQTIHAKSKEMKKREELMQCIFSLQIKTTRDPRIEDIIYRTRNWQLEKERRSQVHERNKIEDDYNKMQKRDLTGFKEEIKPGKVLTNDQSHAAQEKSHREEEKLMELPVLDLMSNAFMTKFKNEMPSFDEPPEDGGDGEKAFTLEEFMHKKKGDRNLISANKLKWIGCILQV